MKLARTLTVFILSVAILIFADAAAAVDINYTIAPGEEKWQATGDRLYCNLSLQIPNYGIATFEQHAAKPAHFILSKWQELEKPYPLTVYAEPPEWKAAGKETIIAHSTIKPGKKTLFLPQQPAFDMLSYLSQGFLTRLQYQTSRGGQVKVYLSPINIQKNYGRFQQCLGNLLTFNYASVKENVFLFGSDNYDLNSVIKEQLDKVSEYSKADARIKKIFIAGYTDDTGRKSYNNAVSEARANAVKKYLLSKGIPESKLSVTWYGIKKPAQPNDTEAGKAANRRVVIKIIK